MATGESQQSLSFTFCLGWTTLSDIISETCNDVLQFRHTYTPTATTTTPIHTQTHTHTHAHQIWFGWGMSHLCNNTRRKSKEMRIKVFFWKIDPPPPPPPPYHPTLNPSPIFGTFLKTGCNTQFINQTFSFSSNFVLKKRKERKIIAACGPQC